MKLQESNILVEKDLRRLIKNFNHKVYKIENYLKLHPNEWGRFQNEFNIEVNAVFREIMNFEKRCLAENKMDKFLKLKKLFMGRIKKPFERGDYIKWVVKKPYGYPGDFKYIEDIYENSPKTVGYDRLFDNYTMMSAIAIAVRNRMYDFKRTIKNYVYLNGSRSLNIMNLGSGPCREILEILQEDQSFINNINFDCYDNDVLALEFSRKRLSAYKNVKFFKKNIIKFALSKKIELTVNKKYDLIYSTGLFDYFEDKITLRLIKNLRGVLNKDGVLLISDVRDRFSNPSLYFMEWVGEWDLVYREDDVFRKLFIEAGFKKQNIFPFYEQQGILQYIQAKA